MKDILDAEVEQFKDDLAKFSGNYGDFLVIAKTTSGQLFWRSTDSTWAVGAAARYITAIDERDRLEEAERSVKS